MSSQIKNTIDLLCKVINLIYKTHLKPEYFRLAKFNKTDENVIPIFWNLLYKILTETDILTIRNVLNSLNYKRKKFYSFTETHCQSRELLLVTGFLLSTHLEEAVKKELENHALSYDYKHKASNLSNPSCSSFNWQTLKESELENYQKWIYGKINLNNNRIVELKECIYNIQKKFNNHLDIKADGSLTVHEILALKDKTYGEQFITDTEPLVNILGVYTEWLKKEKYFWKWMESVLLEDKKEPKKKSLAI